MRQRLAGGTVASGGALIAVGSLLAWMTVGIPGVFSDSVEGMELIDGWFTLASGVILILLGLLMFFGRSIEIWLGWVVLVVGGALAIINYVDIQGKIDDARIGSIGIGMYAMLAGVVIAIVGLAMGRSTASAT